MVSISGDDVVNTNLTGDAWEIWKLGCWGKFCSKWERGEKEAGDLGACAGKWSSLIGRIKRITSDDFSLALVRLNFG